MALPATMTFMKAERPGGPEVLKPATRAVPELRTGEVLIRVMAAGVNRADVHQRMGAYDPPPGASDIIGLEVAGEVVAAAAGAGPWKVGDRICALVEGGGYAEYCAAPATQCLPWPSGYSAVQAAALPETYLTVWANLFANGRFRPHGNYLIHGGSSGIGVTAIQLVAEFGGKAYATAGSKEKCEACLALGAAGAINYKEEDFVAVIKTITGKGVDVVLDIVGAPYVQRNLSALAPGGELVMLAFLGGSKAENFNFGPVVVKRLTITGSTLRPRSIAEKAALSAELYQKVWPVLDAGRCGPVIHTVLPLARAGEAQALMESSRHIGKIMLEVSA
ncbi:MAG: NAD(P)H-quinone oxidoreductase [Pseudorhodoplanes sp.]